MLKNFARALAGIALAVFLTSCAGDGDFRSTRGAPATVPRAIQLDDELSISTIHFPRGLYSLDGEDERGYYYRSQRRVMKHSFAGFTSYEGGIFLPKTSRKLRGYIVWAAGRSKIGDLTRARYSFRD